MPDGRVFGHYKTLVDAQSFAPERKSVTLDWKEAKYTRMNARYFIKRNLSFLPFPLHADPKQKTGIRYLVAAGVHPRASLTYGVLFILLHEVRHDIFNEDDPTDGDKDLQGPVVRGINFLRKALGLPLRTHYSSQYGLELRKIYSSLFPVGLSKRYVIFEGGVISR